MSLKDFILAFIPIFVAVDALGVLPIFISLTQDLKRKKVLKIISDSVITALIVALLFIFIGKSIFRFLGVTVSDFMVAGGIVLFILAINDLLVPTKKWRIPITTLGAAPLGTPLIVGPAVLTTALIIIDTFGLVPTIVSIVSNVFLAGFIFLSANSFIKILGEGGSKAISKVASLLLAAISVMLVRRGIVSLITTHF